jgi:hypothetical protein
MEAINALATSFSNAGVNASTIGTQIRRFSSLMRDNSTAAKEFFLKLGTTQEAFAAQMQKGKKSADEAMTWIAKRLKSLSNEEFQKTIKGMDILASNSITLLRNNADEFLRHFSTLNEGVQGEIDKANLISDGYQASFEKMKVAASDAFISISAEAAPQIQKILDSMANFFDYVKSHSAEVMSALSSIFSAVKWAALTAAIVKVVKSLSSFYISVGESLGVVRSFSVGVSTLATRFWAATTAVRAFLASNPIGWAILGATAIGTVAYEVYNYSTSMDSASEKVTKYAEAQKSTETIEKHLSDSRLQLGRLMNKLSDATHKATDEELKRAAALEYSILKDEQQLKVLREKQKLLELQNKAELGDRNLKQITQEIKYAESENNVRLLGELKRRKERLEEENIRVKVEYGIEKSKTDFKNDALKLLDDYKGVSSILEELKANGVGDLGLKQRQAELEAIEKKLKDVYGIDVTVFDTKHADVELEKYLKTMQGKIQALNYGLEIGIKLPDDIKQRLQAKLQDMKKIFKEHGLKANDILQESDFNKFKEFGQAISNQIKAGMDASPQIAAFYKQFDDEFQRIKAAAAYTGDEMGKSLDSALANVDVSKLDSEFFALINKLKAAQQDFENAASAYDAQQAMTAMKNTMAELHMKYQETAATAVDAAQKMTNAYDSQNRQVQNLTGEMAKLNKALYGDPQKAIDNVNKQLEAMRTLVADSGKLSMSYSEINNKIAEGTDLTWQIRNANLSAKEVDELRIKTKQRLIDLEVALLALMNEYSKVVQNVYGWDSATQEDAKSWMIQRMQELVDKSKNLGKNLKAATGKYKSLIKHSNRAAKSAENHAEQVERAVRAIKKLEAQYRAKLGDYSMSAKLGIEADIMKIEEMGKKAEYSKQKILELKELYIRGAEKDVDYNITSQLGSMSGIEGPTMYMDYQNKLDKLNEYYAKKKEIISIKEQELAELEASGLDIESVEDMRRELDLEKHKLYLQEKWDMDNAYYMNLANTVNAGLTDALNTMQALYNSGLIQSKGWAKAMQAISVAKTIMTTYENAVLAYKAGLEAGGPFGPALGATYAAIAIANGMAQVAMIKQQKFHTGGYVDKPLSTGVGGKKDDEINAVLQKGEYVLSKQEVAQIKAENRRKAGVSFPDSSKQETNNSKSDSLQTRELALLAESMKPEVVIVNSQDPAVIEDWATSRRGREVIQNIVNS